VARTEPWSRAFFRWILRLYPRSFRDWYGADFESDFADLVRERGARAAWTRVITDLLRSMRMSHVTASRERRRVTRLTLGQTGDGSMGTLLFDIRYALRGLARAPVFTLVTVGTLALAIGANSAIFSLVNAALLRPLGYANAERLMLLYESFPERDSSRWGFSPPDFEDLVRNQRSFTHLGAYRLRPFELSGGDTPEQIVAAQVTGEVFALLGVSPARGRLLVPDDTVDPRVVVLSHGLWRRRFGAGDVLGQRLVLSRQPYTIVGVMPATFEFPKRGPQWNNAPADLWMPLVFNAGERQARGNFYNHSVIGRLREGITHAQAASEMPALAKRVRDQYPARLQTFAFSLAITVVPYIDDVSGQVRWPLLVLLAAVGLVLLVACANLANLMLSRAVAREREIGVRTALGAARARLFQMLLTESLCLALLAGGFGLFVGNGLVRAMPAVIQTSLPGVSNVELDHRVVGFALALSVFTAVLFSIVPLVVSGRRSLNDALREGGTSVGSPRRHRLQGGLIVTSVALAFVLLVGAGLLTRSMVRLLAVDSGVRTEGVLSMRVTLPFASYNNAGATRSFYRTLQERLTAIPGVRAASISTDLPLDGDGERRVFTADSMDAPDVSPTVAVTWVHGDYFGAFGIPLVRGRTFSEEEQLENRLTAIVSRELADRYWPGGDAIGKRVRWGLADVLPEKPIWMTVVGVSGDVVDGPPGSQPVMHIYVPYSEAVDPLFAGPIISGFYRAMTISVRTDRDEALVLGPARNAITSIDAALAVTDIETMEQVAAEAMAPQRFSAVVLASFACGGLLLAAIGLYGVLAFAVAQRTREIGIRLALGANAGTVMRMVMQRGMLLTGLGLILGGAGALASARLTRTLLYDTSVYDPWTFLAVLVLLPSVALVACYIPARRATRIDPLIALRAE
jgi:putative ABC transport system permease protein